MLFFDKNITSKNLDEFKLRTASRNEDLRRNGDILRAWHSALNTVTGDLNIMHCISSRGSVSRIGKHISQSPFLTRPAEEVFLSWDVISACCVGRVTLRDGGVTRRAPLDIHLNLTVPVQNIIGTHLHDVAFCNHAGLKGNVPYGALINKSALVESILKGINRHGHKMNTPYNILRHPDEFRRQDVSFEGSHNEVLIVGKPGLRMYMDFPCTESVKLNGVSFRPNYIREAFDCGSNDEIFFSKFQDDLAFIKKILRINSTNKLTFPLGVRPTVRRLNFSRHFEMAGFRQQSDTVYIYRSDTEPLKGLTLPGTST